MITQFARLVGYVKESPGILEKYYRSVAVRFQVSNLKDHTGLPRRTRSRTFSYFKLTESELQMFMEELMGFLTKWEDRISSTGASEVVFDASIVFPGSMKYQGVTC